MINIEEKEKCSSDVLAKPPQTNFLGDQLKILDRDLSVLIHIDAFPLNERIKLTPVDEEKCFSDLPENTFV